MTCAVRVPVISRAVAHKTHNNNNNNMCIVHAHVQPFNTLQRIMPNIQPLPIPSHIVAVVITVVDVIYVYIISALPNQSSYLYTSVCDRDTHFTHTTVYYYYYGSYILFLFICFFIFFRRRVIQFFFFFNSYTAVDNNSTTFTRSFERKIGPSGDYTVVQAVLNILYYIAYIIHIIRVQHINIIVIIIIVTTRVFRVMLSKNWPAGLVPRPGMMKA